MFKHSQNISNTSTTNSLKPLQSRRE